METVRRLLRKLKMELPYAPAPLLDTYLGKSLVLKDTCTPVFTAALFIIGRTWKHPKCPLTDKWVKNMWYIYNMYTMEYYSAIKNEIMPFAATWIDLLRSQRKTNI